MSRFEFKLSRLARVRTVQEQLARSQWQNAESLVRDAEAREAASRSNISAALSELGQAQASAKIDPNRILQARTAIESMERRQASLAQLTQVAREEADRLRSPWQVLRTELEGLKRLEKKAQTAHRIEREREESMKNDEVAIGRARRSQFQLRPEGA